MQAKQGIHFSGSFSPEELRVQLKLARRPLDKKVVLEGWLVLLILGSYLLCIAGVKLLLGNLPSAAGWGLLGLLGIIAGSGLHKRSSLLLQEPGLSAQREGVIDTERIHLEQAGRSLELSWENWSSYGIGGAQLLLFSGNNTYLAFARSWFKDEGWNAFQAIVQERLPLSHSLVPNSPLALVSMLAVLLGLPTLIALAL